MYFGLLYGAAIGFFGLFSRSACSAFYGVHTIDIYLPLVLAVSMVPMVLFALVRAPRDLAMVRLGLEKEEDIPCKKALYKKLQSLDIMDPRFGLKLFGHTIKDGAVFLTINGIEVHEGMEEILKNEEVKKNPSAVKEQLKKNYSQVFSDLSRSGKSLTPFLEEEAFIEEEAKSPEREAGKDEKEEPQEANSPEKEAGKDEKADGNDKESRTEKTTLVLESPKKAENEDPENPKMLSRTSSRLSSKTLGSSKRTNSISFRMSSKMEMLAEGAMDKNDGKLKGTVAGEALLTLEEMLGGVTPDPWYVIIVKGIFKKDGIQ